VKVGDGFYVFGSSLLGGGYELEKRWITQVLPGRVRHAGGATEASDDVGLGWPYGGDPDPEVAFELGRKRRLSGLAVNRAFLEKQLQEVAEEERRISALTIKDVRILGDKETYEQFKRNWDMDY